MGTDYEVNNFSTPEVVYDPSITMRLQGAPYFKHYTEAQNKAIKKDATPYVMTYLGDKGISMPPISTPPAPALVATEPSIQALPAVKATEKSCSSKRYLLVILVVILALAGLAVPFVSSLGVVADYIDIGQDLLTIDTLFSETPTLESITADIPLIILALYALFMAIVFILSVVAIFSSKKIGVGLLAFISCVLGIGYLITALPDLVTYFKIDGLLDEYGKLAMIGLPLLIMIFSSLRYKKIKYKNRRKL